MAYDDEWSVVDSHASDLEVEFQLDFVSWLQIRPSLSSLCHQPFLSFSKQLHIGLFGLIWLLRTPWRARKFTGNGTLDRPSFSIQRVHPLVGAGLEEIGHDISESQGLEVLGADGDWKEDPFEAVERQSAPELGREIRCKGFICAQAVEVAESFVDVLDALFEFSEWYANAERENNDTPQVNEDDGLDWQLEEQKMKSFKLHAKEAIMMCRIAREAMQEASKAAADLLDKRLQKILISHLRKSIAAKRGARNSTTNISEKLEAIEAAARKSEAIHDGFFLQWCTIDNVDDPSCIDCKLEMGELLLEKFELDAVEWVGIDTDKPLRIKIDIRSQSAKVSKEQDLEEGSQKSTIGTSFLMEMASKQLQQFWDGGWALDTENAETLACRGLQTVERNVFVRILQEAARYVMDLSSSICAVCGQARCDEGDFSWAAPCSRALCQAIFEARTAMGTASGDTPPAPAQQGWGEDFIEVQDDPLPSLNSTLSHSVPAVDIDDPWELSIRALDQASSKCQSQTLQRCRCSRVCKPGSATRHPPSRRPI